MVLGPEIDPAVRNREPAAAVEVSLQRAGVSCDKGMERGQLRLSDLGEEDSLRGHLLPGLDPVGVPRELRGTAFAFTYSDRQALADIVKKHTSPRSLAVTTRRFEETGLTVPSKLRSDLTGIGSLQSHAVT